MSIGLTYNPDLSRVQIALSDFPDGSVQVQRVANAAATDALWARGMVRGGVALPIEGGVGNLDDFEFFADIPNHYRVVPVDPPAGLLLTGTSGDFASTPDDPTLDITGDVVLAAEATLNDWATGSIQNLVAKYDGTSNNRSYRLAVTGAGNLRIQSSEDGIGSDVTIDSTVAVPVGAGERLAVRVWLDVNDGAGNHDAIFYTAPTIEGPWTQLGDPVVVPGITSIFAGTAPLEIGTNDVGTSQPATGLIHAAFVIDGNLGGTVVANPDFAAQPGGTTSFTDGAGRAWSVNGDARIVGVEGPEQITPSLAGQVWLKSIKFPALNRPLPKRLDRGQDIKRASRDATAIVAGRSPPVASTELRSTPAFTIHVKTSDVDQAGELDIILAAGGVFFIHVPADSKLPGGYVLFMGDTQQQQSTVADEFMFILPCEVVAPPAPQVTGTLLVAETVFRLYGDANALYAAHSTGRSLVQTILDPGDLVAL